MHEAGQALSRRHQVLTMCGHLPAINFLHPCIVARLKSGCLGIRHVILLYE